MDGTSILTSEGLAVLADEIKKYVQDKIVESRDSVLEFDSSLLFPTVGKINTIYIDKQQNESYRWDGKELKYYLLNDYENIQIIDGCC
jgi:hypothetical protein